jgi:hypothetical protein
MLWTAVVFFFLIGSAALAVDTSGAFGAARADQNTADLACLAGAQEMPNHTDAFNVAASYTDANWRVMTAPVLTITGSTAVYADGSGNMVEMEAGFGGNPDVFYLEITELSDTSFGGALGVETITVTQRAACSGQAVRDGVGLLPIGALAGAWSGDLFDCAAKVTGNCGAVSPDSPGANAYRDAVANGISGTFLKHHGDEDIPDGDTGFAGIDCLATPCNITETETGNMVGPWHAGLELRFTNNGTCREEGWFNCDDINAVFGADLEAALPDPMPGWNDSLFGPFAAAQADTTAQHWYYNGDTMLCLHKRIATIPIINQNLDWELNDPEGTWPTGRKDMKMIGFYTVFIDEPNSIADLGGAMVADIVWFGPNAKCADTNEAFRPFGSTQELDLGVKLVAPD